ncbi:MAG: methyltransferase [Patescibacteria group bacterium]
MPPYIAGLIAAIPIAHLWLHALLPWWKKRPALFYVWAAAVGAAAIYLFPRIATISPTLFATSPLLRTLGWVLMGAGALLVLGSIATLGPRRFFLWAVLHGTKTERAATGPFRLIPHPAYLGYATIALGNILSNGALYLAGPLALYLALMPIVIFFEEEELKGRMRT